MTTDGQQLALEQLEKISKEDDYALEILDIAHPGEKSPLLSVEFSLYCGHFEKAPGGLPLRERERFCVHIPSNFPFSIPSIDSCHQRFAGWSHVQWTRHLCLYQSPETEWIPSDGMFGFINRLEEWLGKGALNELDPIGGVLHPPVAYIDSASSAILVPQKNTPVIEDHNWIGLAKLERINDRALVINDWVEITRETPQDHYAPAILLAEEMPFEFPRRASDLLKIFAERGIDFSRLLWALQCGVTWKNNDEPLFLIIGTPMRGIRGSDKLQQHLTAWEIDPVIAKGVGISLAKYSDHEKIREIGDKVEAIIKEWAETAPVKWCRIRENREEIVTRRDYKSPLTAFKDKTISIWGCGAIGGHIALCLARAGAKKLILRDNGIVTPGILVRQPFREKDIGYAKVSALEDHLKEINSGLQFEKHTTDIKSWLLPGADWTDNADLVIDCSASNHVHSAFEKARMNIKDKRVPVVSMLIDGRATHGLAISIGKDYSGGIQDAYHKAIILVCKEQSLLPYADAFYPEPQKREKLFQPEPGCSDPTFVGSAADSLALSSLMLNASTQVFSLNDESVCAQFVTQHQKDKYVRPASFTWSNFGICTDQLRGYEIRISDDALNKISETINQNNRTNGSSFETGGLLFGRRDDVLKIIWVDEVSEPPPDSEQKAELFICGVEGAAGLNRRKKKRTRRLVRYIGTWHTHPGSIPFPSDIDVSAMGTILMADDFSRDKNLLLIAQPQEAVIRFGGFLFNREDFKENRVAVLDEQRLSEIRPKDVRAGKIGLALSGGGSRAIAFHLGCMRALEDRGVLDDIDVISSVSGGSIIGAMFAYSNDDFTEFDERVVNLLKAGIDKKIVMELFTSTAILHELLAYICGKPLSLIARIVGRQPFMRRRVSRTLSFQKVLAEKLYGTKRITDERRNNIDIVINGTELRTGTSMRFGSKESACWRLGKIMDNNNITVAEAVAASAAYPVFFPAIDREYIFNKKDKGEIKRTILSDGGIYENLGVNCLLPGRNPKYSSNVFNLDYIISCNAGHGMFNEKSVPYGILTRLKQTFETTMRKAQDSVMKDLHQYKTTGRIKGFVLPYLGQQDESLPFSWPDLVNRDKVNYPTNFRPMKEEDIQTLTNRGEQLTRLLLDYYCPEL